VNHRIVNVRAKKSGWRVGRIGKILLALAVIVTGLPLLPNQELPRAYAETSLQINPSTFSSVYGGQTQVNFSFIQERPSSQPRSSRRSHMKVGNAQSADPSWPCAKAHAVNFGAVPHFHVAAIPWE